MSYYNSLACNNFQLVSLEHACVKLHLSGTVCTIMLNSTATSGILLTFNARVHLLCSLRARIKNGIPISCRYSYIHSTCIHIVCYKLTKMLAKNQCDIANWFMHARVSVHTYVAIHHHTTWWLIDYDAHKASIYIYYI